MYKRVAILGVDGMGHFNAQAETPHMDELFAVGAVTYKALTSVPTDSGPCWGSMLLGVEAQIHGLTNKIVRFTPRGPDFPYPSIFRAARDAMPAAELAAICNWNPIYSGILEGDLGLHTDTADSDAAVCEKILAYLDSNDPALLFVQFDEVDDAGQYIFGSERFLEQITRTDVLLGKIVAKYRERGWAEDTLFIVSADHGGNGDHHGSDSDNEKLIFIGCAGKTVKPGAIGDMNVQDIAAITAAALGLEAPAAWTAKVPEGLFA